MHHYIIGATSHLEDSVEDVRSRIYRSIYGKRKWQAEEVFEKILAVTEGGGKGIHLGELGRDHAVGEG